MPSQSRLRQAGRNFKLQILNFKFSKTTFNPGITVGIPYHSESNPEFFVKAIQSILNQSMSPVELHLIQDGRVNDNLKDIARSFCEKNNFIKSIVIPQNKGLAFALNLSILLSTTEYYARMDADDISHPERLKKQAAFLDLHPETDIAGCWALEFVNEADKEKGFLKKMPVSTLEMGKTFHYRDPFVHPTVMFRRSVFAKIGLYNTDFKANQDTELWARALKKGIGVANIPEPLFYFRIGSMISKRSDIPRILSEAKARYTYNTWSPVLNIMKIISLSFRFLPAGIRKWAYSKLR